MRISDWSSDVCPSDLTALGGAWVTAGRSSTAPGNGRIRARHEIILPRIGGRMLDADVGPGAEVVDRIDDATSDPAIRRTCAEIAVLLEGPAGEAEKARENGSASWGERVWEYV